MLFFGKKKSTVSRTRSLGAKPVQLVNATVKPGDDGGAKVTIPLRPVKWTRWFFRMPAGASKTFELDALGMLVWTSCDGKTTVQQIIRKLSKKYGLSLREAEVPTVRFLQMLVKKGLIGMDVKAKKDN